MTTSYRLTARLCLVWLAADQRSARRLAGLCLAHTDQRSALRLVAAAGLCGDILKTAETRPRQRYGLDPVLLWPHLWLTLPENVRQELAAARHRLDRLAQAWLWGLLFAAWSFVWPWAGVIALVWMGLAYTMALEAAASFCDLLLATFDIHRWRLYEALRWPLPAESGADERSAGQALTRFVQRGLSESPIAWKHPEKSES